MQKQVQKQAQIYQQQKKLIKKQKDIKAIVDQTKKNNTVQPAVNPNINQSQIQDSPSAADKLAAIKLDMLNNEAKLLEIANEIKALLDSKPTVIPTAPKDPVNITPPVQATQPIVKTNQPSVQATQPIAQATPLQAVKPATAPISKPVQKPKVHKRVCPVCFELSIFCPWDRERLRKGEVWPCGCTDCLQKNYIDSDYYY